MQRILPLTDAASELRRSYHATRDAALRAGALVRDRGRVLVDMGRLTAADPARRRLADEAARLAGGGR